MNEDQIMTIRQMQIKMGGLTTILQEQPIMYLANWGKKRWGKPPLVVAALVEPAAFAELQRKAALYDQLIEKQNRTEGADRS